MSKSTDRTEAIETLRKLLPPGSVVYTSLRGVARSGMTRWIDVHAIIDNEPRWLGGYVARATGYNLDDRKQGLRVSGCGMDMGYHVVNTLSAILYPEGFTCIGEGCPSNDHSNGDRDYAPHEHKSGDYALKHRWL